MGGSDPGDARSHRVIALQYLGLIQMVADGRKGAPTQQADALTAVHAISVCLFRRLSRSNQGNCRLRFFF